MKKLLFAFLLTIPFSFINPQGIGELAPEKAPEVFPNNVFGMDIMFSEGGFGLGTFYRRQLSQTITGFADFSISEAKDENVFFNSFISFEIFISKDLLYFTPLFSILIMRDSSSIFNADSKEQNSISSKPSLLK